jgi:hypothetical protein
MILQVTIVSQERWWFNGDCMGIYVYIYVLYYILYIIYNPPGQNDMALKKGELLPFYD